MAGTLGRNLHLCFTKLKCSILSSAESTSVTTNLLSSEIAPDDNDSPTRLPLFKNHNSLYDSTSDDFDVDDFAPKSQHYYYHCTPSDEPDLSTVLASQRFFFSSPGRSNSIVDSATSCTESSDTLKYCSISDMVDHSSSSSLSSGLLNVNPAGEKQDQQQQLRDKAPKVKDGVAVSTYSPDPYMDFRRSMQEMVEARELVDVKASWDYLHELLSCYLELNPKNTHKFIVGAFADLLVTLLSSTTPETTTSTTGAHQQQETDQFDGAAGGCEIPRQYT